MKIRGGPFGTLSLCDARMKLAGLFGVLLGAVVEGERSHCRIVTRTIDFDGEIGAGD